MAARTPSDRGGAHRLQDLPPLAAGLRAVTSLASFPTRAMLSSLQSLGFRVYLPLLKHEGMRVRVFSRTCEGVSAKAVGKKKNQRRHTSS